MISLMENNASAFSACAADLSSASLQKAKCEGSKQKASVLCIMERAFSFIPCLLSRICCHHCYSAGYYL